jgi:hypothetical protein
LIKLRYSFIGFSLLFFLGEGKQQENEEERWRILYAMNVDFGLVQLDPSFLFFYLSFFLFSFNSLLPFFFEKKKIVTFSLWLFNSYPAALVLHFLSFIISSLVQWLPCCFENSYLFIYCF